MIQHRPGLHRVLARHLPRPVRNAFVRAVDSLAWRGRDPGRHHRHTAAPAPGQHARPAPMPLPMPRPGSEF